MQHSISCRADAILKQFTKTNNHLPESGIYNPTTMNSEKLETALADVVTKICRATAANESTDDTRELRDYYPITEPPKALALKSAPKAEPELF
uniref:Uncharacterized protein n=1 Tax=Glossina austeni TaxID=7395 RepID=A0A1A9V1S1_GLOAU